MVSSWPENRNLEDTPARLATLRDAVPPVSHDLKASHPHGDGRPVADQVCRPHWPAERRDFDYTTRWPVEDVQVCQVTSGRGATIDAGLRNDPFGGRPDVEQVVSALAGDVHQLANEDSRRFPILVVAREAPRIIDGGGRLPVRLQSF